MDDAQRRALASLRFNWAPTPDSVWRPPVCHVDGLNREAVGLIVDGVEDARRSADSSPIGAVLVGQRGTGKTHLLGAAREHVQDAHGYFFLISLLDAGAFWRSAILSIMDGLLREPPGRDRQLSVFLRRLADRVNAPRTIRRAVTGGTRPTPAALDAFVDLLRKADRQIGTECRDTARALVLLASDSEAVQEIGHAFLLSNDEEEDGERAAWGLRRAKRSAQEIVRDLSRLLALTGPTLMAVDQIDLLIAQARHRTGTDPRGEWSERLLLEQIASGLMALRDITRRTLTVVTCLPHSWDDVKKKATDTVRDRFREADALTEIPSAALARELVEKRAAASYGEVGYTPPYPTWPVRPEAFEEAVHFTPRELLITIDNHVRTCLRDGAVGELEHLQRPYARTPEPAPTPVGPATLNQLDARFAAFRDVADVGPALNEDTEDSVVPDLLAAGFTAWVAERGTDARSYSLDPPPGPKPALHGRLLRSLDETHEDETHWAFRAIAASHGVSALNRIRNAITASGLTEGVTSRRLFLLRNDDWSSAPKTREVVEAFEHAGGRRLPFPPADVRILIALRELFRTEDPATVRAWCADRRPTKNVTFLQALTDDEDDRARSSTPTGPSVVIGRRTGGDPVLVELEALRKHTAIFAGSGSGKTVLIRRLIEECALRGVSAIVLDPNNDLARLGDAWPEPPSTWDGDDAVRAKEYLDNTDVVVWTPRREAGRPLSFQPLPDFAGVLDDADEFSVAVDAAVEALAPRAKVDGPTTKAQLGKAVLRQALIHYARRQGSSLSDFIDMLSDLPDGASALQNAHKIAADLSQTLHAATVNDPLFGGGGTPMDPGVLLTPPDGKRARVSVISFVGLPAEEQRQSFVNQLQLALFAWIRRNPAGDRPLGGLLVMDEAQTLAPSGAMTACTHSTLALASQARKYGLGLVFATQAPKGLHNRIPGNAATQLFGLLNSPAHIAAAREIARAKGTDVPDIARLSVGQFYAAVAGGGFDKVQTSMCLSYHPSSPLTTEEVVEHARATRP